MSVISVLGLPGTGKSTLIRRLAQRLSAKVFHVPTFARERGFAEIKGPSGLLEAPGLIPAFLDKVGVALQRGEIVILDGFPRDLQRVQWLAEKDWHVAVLHLCFPAGSEFEHSLQRQRERAADGGKPLSSDTEDRVRAMLLHDTPVVDELRRIGYPVCRLDCLLPEEQIEQQAAAFLGR